MRILWHSNAPWSSSGYGNQTALTAPRIRDLGHDVAISCFFGLEGGTIEWEGITCFPTDHTRFGLQLLGEYARLHGGGDRGRVTTITLMDVWVLLQGLPNMQGVRFVPWCPVDHDPCPPNVIAFLKQTQSRTIAMSEFGRRKLQEGGVDPIAMIPHLVPCDVFRPKPEDKQAIREELHIPRDAFVIGMVANNQGLPSRKSFAQVFAAYQQFQRKHSDAILHLHADILGRNNGINLVELAKGLGVPQNAVTASDQLKLYLNVDREAVANVFNAFDVLAMPSMGEGFGIPLVEAQACGVPVITTDWTAMTELCGAGWLVDGDPFYDATQHSWFKNPSIGEIHDAMEIAYDRAETMSGQAREFAVRYDADKVWRESWVPVLEELASPREIEPLEMAA